MVHLATFIFLVATIANAVGQDKLKYISAKGDQLAGIDTNGIVKVFNGTWTALAGINGVKIASVGTSPDGWHHATGDDFKTYRFNPGTKVWDYHGFWTCTQASAMSKDLVQYRCYNSGGTYWQILNGGGSLITGTPMEGGDGVGSRVNWVSIGSDGETWIIAADGQVYRKNTAANKWDQLPILNAANLDVENAKRAVVTTKCCWAYIWDGASFTKMQTPGCVKQATINKNNAFYIDELLDVYNDFPQ